MTTLKFAELHMIGANLGSENCLPDIKNNAYIQAKICTTENIKEEDRKYIGKGMIQTILPYQMQDGYDRSRENKAFKAAILENEYLKATFIPELGGRLWSLYDKKADRELLYVNPIFQPCNLALRNAWISGGVEWNVGIKGHTPLTCSPLFAQELIGEDGEPMLRMYEFERIREVCYSITAKLKKDMLLVNISIENTDDKEKYMYWWSNIAVDEREKTRVIVPASEAFYCSYKENGYVLDATDVPYFNGTDISYPRNLEVSRDFFYKIPEKEDKWIAAINEDGKGLLHMSDAVLSGRKYFAWGESQGGRHWNEWLSGSKDKYIEIQAGLLKTQLEHFVMKAHSEITWTEAYTGIVLSPEQVHNTDINTAIQTVKKDAVERNQILSENSFRIEKVLPIQYYGSGWGYIEEKLRQKPISKHVQFPTDSVTEKEKEWFILLEKGYLNLPDHKDKIKSYVKGTKWKVLLEGLKDSWYKWYHLGVIYYEAKEYDKAYSAFETSAEMKENPWAYRNLAQIDKNIRKNYQKAYQYMSKAVELKADYIPLWIDFAQTCMEAGCYHEWMERYEALSESYKSHGRLKVYYIQALNAIGKYEQAYQMIMDHFIMYDVREGEYSVSRLYIEICANLINKGKKKALSDEEVLAIYPLPYELDYRM